MHRKRVLHGCKVRFPAPASWGISIDFAFESLLARGPGGFPWSTPVLPSHLRRRTILANSTDQSARSSWTLHLFTPVSILSQLNPPLTKPVLAYKALYTFLPGIFEKQKWEKISLGFEPELRGQKEQDVTRIDHEKTNSEIRTYVYFCPQMSLKWHKLSHQQFSECQYFLHLPICPVASAHNGIFNIVVQGPLPQPSSKTQLWSWQRSTLFEKSSPGKRPNCQSRSVDDTLTPKGLHGIQ